VNGYGFFSGGEPSGRSLERTQEGVVLKAGGVDRPDYLVAAAELFLISESDAFHRLSHPPSDDPDGSRMESAEQAMRKAGLDVRVPITVNMQGRHMTEEDKALYWLDRVYQTVSSMRLGTAHVILWEASWDRLRGAFWGHPANSVEFSRKAQHVQILRAENAPCPLFTVSLLMKTRTEKP
jgi:hypothetical protein